LLKLEVRFRFGAFRGLEGRRRLAGGVSHRLGIYHTLKPRQGAPRRNQIMRLRTQRCATLLPGLAHFVFVTGGLRHLSRTENREPRTENRVTMYKAVVEVTNNSVPVSPNGFPPVS